MKNAVVEIATRFQVKPEIRQRHENEVNGKCKIGSLITVISCLQLIMTLP